MKTILDRANAFIGHEQEVDEGYETTMRRNAFIAGFKDALELVKKMREAQKGKETMESFAHEWDSVDSFKYDELRKEQKNLESEVDKLIKEI